MADCLLVFKVEDFVKLVVFKVVDFLMLTGFSVAEFLPLRDLKDFGFLVLANLDREDDPIDLEGKGRFCLFAAGR